MMLYDTEDSEIMELNNTTWEDEQPTTYYCSACSMTNTLQRNSSSCECFLGLPEMPLQRSVSSDVEFFSDWDKHKSSTCSVHDDAVLSNSSGERDTQLKRSRHEVHSISERKRRSKINGELKILHEMMPHCRKKDKVTVLGEAVKYIKALKQHVETMTKLREGQYGAPMMAVTGNSGFQNPLVPMQTCYTPFVQLPFGAFPTSSSTVPSFCVPTLGSYRC